MRIVVARPIGEVFEFFHQPPAQRRRASAARLREHLERFDQARLACYEARKLNNPPNSLYDYNDAKRGDEPPAERRARERRDNRPPR